MADRRRGGRADRRRQRGGEDEAGRIGAHRIDQRAAPRDIAAQATERLGERALDHVDAPHHALLLGHAAAARTIHADGVHLVQIGHRAILLGEVANALDRRKVAVHRIEALEHDELGLRRIGRLQQILEMLHVVVPEDLLLAPGLAHALDHGIVVEGVGQDQAVGKQLGDGRDAGLVRHVARGEDEGAFLAVQVGELLLERDQGMIGAGDVAGAAGAGAHPGRGLHHRPDHLGVLAHAQIVVGAPHDDVTGAVGGMPNGARKAPGQTFQVGKNPIAPLVLEPGESAGKKHVVIHENLPGGPIGTLQEHF